MSTPTPDRGEIARALNLLHPHGVVELRALFQRGRKRTAAGYYDPEHRTDLVEQAAKLNEQGAAVYITMNPVDPQLLGRYSNRVEDYAQATATDANVVRRHWLLIDIDPHRPKDTSATQEQLEAAKDVGRQVYVYLQERGWPRPVIADSGNGLHLLYRIDLQNDEASRELVKDCLAALAERFDTDAVKIDKSVYNAGRIVKLHGTVATKGDNTPAAPWRLSGLRLVPDELRAVPIELLQALASELKPADRPNGHDRTGTGAMAWTADRMEGFLRKGGIEWMGEPEVHDGSLRWRLTRCPFNSDHGPTEAAVFLKADGVLGFKCLHNGCAGYHWSDLRALVDGPRESRKGSSWEPTKPTKPGFVSFGSAQDGRSIQSLPAPLPAVPAFDLDLLPETVRPWVEDHAEALQCPPEYVAVGAMVALAGTIGRQVAICVKQRERWIERSVLWGCIVGRPSAGKSPALRPAYGMLTRLEGQSWDDYQNQLREYEARQLVATAAKENARKAARKKLAQGDRGGALEAAEAAILSEEEPQQARLVVNDGTIEAIGAILNANPRGLVQFRDELSGWLASLDREGREGDRAFWLECWAGAGPYVVDRIGRGTVRVEACAVSILGGTQPGKLAEYVRACCKGGSGDDGLLPRFQLAVYPDAPKEWRYLDREPNQAALDACWRVFQRLNAIDASKIGAERSDFIDVPYLRFSPEAQGLFAEWQTELMARLRTGKEPPFLESHFAKYPALVARLALVTHLADAGEGAVSAEALGKALDWTVYLEGHATRIYAPVTDNGLMAAHALLAKRSEIPGPFTLRELHRKGWAGLDREALQGAIDCLEEYGYLDGDVIDTGGSGGRPTVRYQWRAER
jgi:hypothetical protein